MKYVWAIKSVSVEGTNIFVEYRYRLLKQSKLEEEENKNLYKELDKITNWNKMLDIKGNLIIQKHLRYFT